MSVRNFERIGLVEGPRKLPLWARDAHIDWMDGYGNSPHLKVRCRTDPLAFAKFGNPAWEKVGSKTWIAERDGVAAVHYHEGAVRPAKFTRKIGGEWDITKPQLLDGEPWIDTTGLWPDQIPNAKPKMGGTEHETFTMLATTQQEGYAGRHFDITLKDGTDVRLRGPWHGGAPDGFVELYYDIDDHLAKTAGRPNNRWYRKWYARGGYFGLFMRPEVLLDIFATFLPHVPWAMVADEKRCTLQPLRPETGLPKGFHVDPARCPGHRYGMTAYQSGPHPGDRCALCNERRDPSWVSPYERKPAQAIEARRAETRSGSVHESAVADRPCAQTLPPTNPNLPEGRT